MKKAIIGIVAKNFDKEDRPSTFISDEIKNAIIINGGVPIGIIPTDKGIHSIKKETGYKLHKTDIELLIEQIKLCDGIVMQGYWDSYYFELEIIRYCVKNNIPLLCICAGHSNLAIAFGGSIRPSNKEKHLKGMDEYAHDITIVPHTLFHKIIGKDKMQVNSSHNNHLDIVPAEFIISAYDCDGFPEVIEYPQKRFCVGMKFHPECLAEKDENHNKIFNAFVEATQRGK